LDNALGTERDLQIAALPLDESIDPIRRSRVERGPQPQKLSVAQMRQEGIDALLDDAAHRIEEFIDRRSDGDDHRAAGRYLARLAREEQALLSQRLGQQRLRPVLEEWHLAGFQRRKRLLVDVVD